MSRRGLAAFLALGLCTTACTVRIGPGGSSSNASRSGARTYRVSVEQIRRGSGITKTPARHSIVRAKIEEVREGTALTVRVLSVGAEGEQSQIDQARRLEGKTITFERTPQGWRTGQLGLAGPEDLGALDVALLFQLVAPVVQTTGSTTLPEVSAPWANGPLAFSVQRRSLGKRWTRWILAEQIETKATSTLQFRLPIARRSSGGGSSGEREPLVDQVFASLFAPIESGDIAGGLATAIAAIPFAIAAPFLAIADALGGLFGGGGGGGPRLATIPLNGEVQLEQRTAIYGRDATVLRSTGRGEMHLHGTLPPLTGKAARLSEKPIALDADWIYTKKLVGPWPIGILLPAVALIAADVVGFAIVTRRRRVAARAARPAATPA